MRFGVRESQHFLSLFSRFAGEEDSLFRALSTPVPATQIGLVGYAI